MCEGSPGCIPLDKRCDHYADCLPFRSDESSCHGNAPSLSRISLPNICHSTPCINTVCPTIIFEPSLKYSPPVQDKMLKFTPPCRGSVLGLEWDAPVHSRPLQGRVLTSLVRSKIISESPGMRPNLTFILQAVPNKSDCAGRKCSIMEV